MAAKLISPKALRQAVRSNAVVLVFVEWCGECQRMAPVFEAVANELKGGGLGHVHFCRLDYGRHGAAITAEQIGRNQGTFVAGFHECVKEFPTIVLFQKNPASMALYDVHAGGADAAALKATIRAFFDEEEEEVEAPPTE